MLSAINLFHSGHSMRGRRCPAETWARRWRTGLLRVGLFGTILLPVGSYGQLVINELMYHPYRPYPIMTNLAEYVEVHNAGTATVNLAEYRFDNGIDYLFSTNDVLAPGGFFVVCRDAAAFAAAYPGVTNVGGPYDGALDNGGERVTLSQRVGGQWVEAHSISYVDIGASDGEGPSLELVHPGFAALRDHYPGAWAVSTSTNGTPGAQNSVFNAAAPPAIGNVRHTPSRPPAGSSVRFTATVGTVDGIPPNQVTLLYRYDALAQLPWDEIQMEDLGMNGDDVAHDGIYTVRLPEFGEPPFETDRILEFKIRAIDSNGRVTTAPVESWSGVETGPFSYLLKFGEDSGYTGEYTTYHILITESNRIGPTGLETRALQSDVLLDATLVTGDGEVFYNCGLRYRGGSSRNKTFGGYRIELPRGQSFETYREINLNHLNALSQYAGLALAERLGYGCMGQEVALSRVWMNNTQKVPNTQGIYVRIEGFDRHIIGRNFTDTTGNLYKTDGDGIYDGDLSYTSDLSEYVDNSTGNKFYNYMASINNPYTAFKDLQALCLAANRPAAELPSALATNMNWRQWARLYALQVAIANDESGWLCPYSTRGDEVRIYGDPSTGLFHLFPWDMDSALYRTDTGIWQWNHGVTRNFLFNRPMISDYAGDVLDIFNTVMSVDGINALCDEMGSALSSSTRASWLNSRQTRFNNTLAVLKTNLTVTASGTLFQGTLATIVNTASSVFSGDAPMNYTASLRVNGAPAAWTAWSTADMGATYGKWSLPAPLALAPGANTVTVETFDNAGNRLLHRELTVVNRATYSARSGTVSVNTTWNGASGVIVVDGNVTVTSGARLTIAAGTTVLVNSGLGITVNNGMIDVQGTAASPVWFVSGDGSGAWTMTATGASASLVVSNAVTVGGAVVVASGAQAALTDSTLRNSTNAGGILQSSGGASVTLTRCIVSDFVKTAFSASTLSVSDSLFRWMTAVGIEVTGGTAAIQRTTVRASSAAAGVDGIRALAGAAVTAERCLLLDTRGSGLTASGTSTQAALLHSTVGGAGTGVKRASPATMRNVNNTIVGGTLGFESEQAVTNAIVWANAESVTSGPASVSYSVIEQAGTNAYAGVGNLNRNPWFREPAERDYRLRSYSPCSDAGSDGLDMGAAFPVGANPHEPTGLTAAGTISGGTNRVTLSWQDNSADESGFEIWRRVPAGNWALLAITAPDAEGYADLTILDNQPYEYRVRAVHARGESFFTPPEDVVSSFSAYTQVLIDNLRITEIMYNPPSSDDLDEFLEIKNISFTETLELSGAYLDNDRYVFPEGFTLGPQQFFVLARNAAAFQAVHGFAPDAQFAVDDRLANGGENLWIRDAQGNRVFYAGYQTGNLDWAVAADGQGYSLVPVNPNAAADADPFSSAYWRASAYPGGSPGEDDPEPPYGTIVINEVLTHTDPPMEDAVELYNAGTNAVDIAGWFLSDRADYPRAYVIPGPSLVLQPGQYHVFYEFTSFNADTNAPNAFTFSSLGEGVYLSSGNGTNLTSYRTGFEFSAAFNGVSFGRHVRGDGQVDYPPMSARTFGSDDATTPESFRTGTGLPNAYPYVPPVVINEIMYAPSTRGGHEFIELYNRTASPVPLYDPDFPTNTWQLRNAVFFTFPTGIVMEAGEHLIVTHVDPELFRADFGITNQAVRILGPFDGRLANEAESVELYIPDGLTDGLVPYVLIDMAHYEATEPWPTAAAGQGPSLERIDPAAYGNDPANWKAATIGGTPGASNNTAGLPSVAFAQLTSAALENAGTVTIPVILEPVATDAPVTVNYAVTGGSAAPGVNYTLADGSLCFWPYDRTNHIAVTLLVDGVFLEPEKTVVITMSGVSPNVRLGGIAQHTLRIVDTDIGSVSAPEILPVEANFYNAVEVTMTSATPYAVIWYTLDGSTPVVSNPAGGYSPTRRAMRYATPLLLTAGTRVKATAMVGDYNASTVSSHLFVEKTPMYEYPPGTIAVQIGQGTDDAEESNGLAVRASDPQLLLGRNASYVMEYGGLRFTDIGIPQGADVTNAYVQFTSASVGVQPLTVKIYGQDHDSAPTFNPALLGDIRPTTDYPGYGWRERTTSFTSWQPPEWTGANIAGSAQRTPDLSTVIQEVVDRPGWSEGNAIVLLMTYTYTKYPTGPPYASRPSKTYENSPEASAVLFVQYDINSVGPRPDADGDGMPDQWEIDHFGSTDAVNGGPTDDWDHDGADNLSEYIADTDPTDNRSLFVAVEVAADISGHTIRWPSVTTRLYSVWRMVDLIGGAMEPLQINIAGHTSGTNSYTDGGNTNSAVFYRIKVAVPE